MNTDWVCPKCGRHLAGITDKTEIVSCGGCGEVIRRNELPSAPSKRGGVEFILKGSWPGKEIKKGDRDEK